MEAHLCYQSNSQYSSSYRVPSIVGDQGDCSSAKKCEFWKPKNAILGILGERLYYCRCRLLGHLYARKNRQPDDKKLKVFGGG